VLSMPVPRTAYTNDEVRPFQIRFTAYIAVLMPPVTPEWFITASSEAESLFGRFPLRISPGTPLILSWDRICGFPQYLHAHSVVIPQSLHLFSTPKSLQLFSAPQISPFVFHSLNQFTCFQHLKSVHVFSIPQTNSRVFSN
jgi:hypothetical protein